jgi:hypothetical protein
VAGRWTHHREIGSSSRDVMDSKVEAGVIGCNQSRWHAHSKEGGVPFVAIIVDGVTNSVVATIGSNRTRGTLRVLGRVEAVQDRESKRGQGTMESDA